MTWREALDDARTDTTVALIAGDVSRERERAYARLAQALDGAADFAEAARQVRALMFVERFAADVDERLAALER